MRCGSQGFVVHVQTHENAGGLVRQDGGGMAAATDGRVHDETG